METNKKLYSIALVSTILILFITILSTASAVTAQSSQLTITETQISHSGKAYNGFPDIYDDKIVWSDQRNEDWRPDIYMYDLSTNQETQISTSGRTESPKIYGNKIVWHDKRNSQYSTEGDVYMYDLYTHQEIQIPTSGRAVSPDIYGNRVVWRDYRNSGSGNIYMYDLSTNQETQISTSNAAWDPAIYGDKIVWSDKRNGGLYPSSGNIYMYDLSTHQETQISTSNAAMGPDIYEDRIVWSDDRNSEGSGVVSDIYMYDLSTNQETQISASGRAGAPEIYGNRIVWQDYRDGNFNIYLYDLSTSEEIHTIIQTTDPDKSYPAIYGDRIVWRYGYENADIYMGTVIEEILSPILPTANFTNNVTQGYVPLSVQFTDLSENATEWNWDFGDGTASTNQNATHTYSATGIYIVNLTASNESGTDSKLVTITVLAAPEIPTANFSASPTVGKAPLTVTFTDSSTGSPTSWSWNFGDRSVSTDQSPVHTYNKAGKYTVSLTVKNELGSNTKKISKYIIVKK